MNRSSQCQNCARNLIVLSYGRIWDALEDFGLFTFTQGQ